MTCKNCGKELQDYAFFCAECGAAVEQESSQAVEPAVKAQAQNREPIGFFEAVRLFFQKYIDFKGRATRAEYWWVVLFTSAVGIIGSHISIVGEIADLVFLVPSLALAVRRLHDTGKKWTFLLWNLLPIAGVIIYIIQLAKPSQGDNEFGPAPK